MKLRSYIVALLISLVPAVYAADEQPSAPPPAMPAHPHHETTELGGHMDKIGHAFRALSHEVADPTKNEDSLKQVGIIRTNAEAALKLTPAKAADLPEDKRAGFVADYQEDMKKFLADVDSLEAALKAGNNAQAAQLAKKMKSDMEDSHKQFRKKKKDDM